VTIQAVVLICQPELHGRRIDVLNDANTPMSQLVTRRGIDELVLGGALPLAVLAVHDRITDPEEVPSKTTRQVEEAGAEVAANRIGIHVAVTRGTREEQARRHVTDRQRAGKLAHFLVAVRRADERAVFVVKLRPDGVADGAGNADTVELTGIA